MTPKEGSALAQKLWEKAQREDEWPDEVRMAFLSGACHAIQHLTVPGSDATKPDGR